MAPLTSEDLRRRIAQLRGRLRGAAFPHLRDRRHWNAILLLDEADVFLEQCSTQDLVRNGLVSVFLRKLEYCQAIMFMTTNRASQFDEAVLSRIHLMLRYENLGTDA